MKYFFVEGILKSQNPIDENIMKEHIAYSKGAMDKGLILMSGLKSDMSGGMFIMKSNSIEEVNKYLNNELFKLHGIQDYKVIEFSPHYYNQSPSEWFNN